jgi:hypothetical protein
MQAVGSKYSDSVCGSADDELGVETIKHTIVGDSQASQEKVVMLQDLQCDMEAMVEAMVAAQVEAMLATLTARESAILRCHYGLNDGCPLTFEQIGEMFGASSFPPSCTLCQLSGAFLNTSKC